MIGASPKPLVVNKGDLNALNPAVMIDGLLMFSFIKFFCVEPGLNFVFLE